MILDFKTASKKARRQWENVFKILSENDLKLYTQPNY